HGATDFPGDFLTRPAHHPGRRARDRHHVRACQSRRGPAANYREPAPTEGWVTARFTSQGGTTDDNSDDEQRGWGAGRRDGHRRPFLSRGSGAPLRLPEEGPGREWNPHPPDPPPGGGPAADSARSAPRCGLTAAAAGRYPGTPPRH